MAEWQDRILVADTKLQRVLIFDQQGEQLAVFGQAGDAAVGLLAPVDVAVLREQADGKAGEMASVAVLDAGNNRLQRFTLSMRTTE